MVNKGGGSNALAGVSQGNKAAANLTTKIVTSSSATSLNIFGKIKRTIEWIIWWGGRFLYNANTAPGSPDVYLPPPGWKPEDWYNMPVSIITNIGR